MIDVKETLNSAAQRMEMAAMYLAEELSHVRAGRANVAILDGVRVNSYGSICLLYTSYIELVVLPYLICLVCRDVLDFLPFLLQGLEVLI